MNAKHIVTPSHHSITVKRPYGGRKILRFSNEIAVYFANGTR